MKKRIALLLALLMMVSLSATAFAAGVQTGTMTITAEIPEASFTMHIPADMTLEYGNTEKQEVGEVYVTDVTGFAAVTVQFPYTDLINTSDPTDTIPLVLYEYYESEGQDHSYELRKDGITTSSSLPIVYNTFSPEQSLPEGRYATVMLDALVSDWSGATVGATYQAQVTFQFEGR